MKDKSEIKLLQKAEYYSSTEYPEFVDYATKQQHSHWLHTDASVDNDLHSMLVELSIKEREAIIYVLKLFVHYELRLGSNFWAAIGNTIPRSEVQRMCSTFANMEIAVHSPFYAEVNRLLNLDNPEFYLEYKEDPILVSRMKFLEDNCKLGKNASIMDILITLATLSLIEGVVLYSSFALLKSFQANGSNSIPNIVTGVDYVVVDEQLHSEGAASLFHVLMKEAELTAIEEEVINNKIKELSRTVIGHEFCIIDKVLENGDLPNIKKEELRQFIKSRSVLITSYLGVNKSKELDSGNIGKWFYKNINSPTLTDFFNRTATEYTRDWSEQKLGWVND